MYIVQKKICLFESKLNKQRSKKYSQKEKIVEIIENDIGTIPSNVLRKFLNSFKELFHSIEIRNLEQIKIYEKNFGIICKKLFKNRISPYLHILSCHSYDQSEKINLDDINQQGI